MRFASLGVLLLLLVGCLEVPTGDPLRIPVVVLTSEFSRFYKNGTRWEPPIPGPHGCPDDFEVESLDQRVRVDSDWGGDLGRARAVISAPDRDPEAHFHSQELVLPPSLPYEHVFVMGNVEPYNVTLRIEDRDHVSFNGVDGVVGAGTSQRFDYEWLRSDGTVLDVTELVDFTFEGAWVDPLEPREPVSCR